MAMLPNNLRPRENSPLRQRRTNPASGSNKVAILIRPRDSHLPLISEHYADVFSPAMLSPRRTVDLSIEAHRTAARLFLRMMRFVGEDAPFGGFAAASLLAASFFDPGPFGGGALLSNRLDFIDEELSRQRTIHTLIPANLALDLNTGGSMQQHHAGRSLIDVLAPMTARADKTFIDILLANSEHGHPSSQFIVLL
jgi:hypothetical protein